MSGADHRQPPGPNAGDIIDDTFGVCGGIALHTDEPAGETPAGRGAAELQALFHTSTVRRILEELNERPKFQMPQRLRERKNFLAEAWNTEC